jgi:hypothetical protein
MGIDHWIELASSFLTWPGQSFSFLNPVSMKEDREELGLDLFFRGLK